MSDPQPKTLSVIQHLHDLGINAGIQSYHNAGGQWTAWLGDPMHGHAADQDGMPDYDACEAWLMDKATELYPTKFEVQS